MAQISNRWLPAEEQARGDVYKPRRKNVEIQGQRFSFPSDATDDEILAFAEEMFPVPEGSQIAQVPEGPSPMPPPDEVIAPPAPKSPHGGQIAAQAPPLQASHGTAPITRPPMQPSHAPEETPAVNTETGSFAPSDATMGPLPGQAISEAIPGPVGRGARRLYQLGQGAVTDFARAAPDVGLSAAHMLLMGPEIGSQIADAVLPGDQPTVNDAIQGLREGAQAGMTGMGVPAGTGGEIRSGTSGLYDIAEKVLQFGAQALPYVPLAAVGPASKVTGAIARPAALAGEFAAIGATPELEKGNIKGAGVAAAESAAGILGIYGAAKIGRILWRGLRGVADARAVAKAYRQVWESPVKGDVTPEVRTSWREFVKDIHPDRATSAADLKARTEFLKRANAARDANNQGALEQVRKDWVARSTEAPPAEKPQPEAEKPAVPPPTERQAVPQRRVEGRPEGPTAMVKGRMRAAPEWLKQNNGLLGQWADGTMGPDNTVRAFHKWSGETGHIPPDVYQKRIEELNDAGNSVEPMEATPEQIETAAAEQQKQTGLALPKQRGKQPAPDTGEVTELGAGEGPVSKEPWEMAEKEFSELWDENSRVALLTNDGRVLVAPHGGHHGDIKGAEVDDVKGVGWAFGPNRRFVSDVEAQNEIVGGKKIYGIPEFYRAFLKKGSKGVTRAEEIPGDQAEIEGAGEVRPRGEAERGKDLQQAEEARPEAGDAEVQEAVAGEMVIIEPTVAETDKVEIDRRYSKTGKHGFTPEQKKWVTEKLKEVYPDLEADADIPGVELRVPDDGTFRLTKEGVGELYVSLTGKQVAKGESYDATREALRGPKRVKPIKAKIPPPGTGMKYSVAEGWAGSLKAEEPVYTDRDALLRKDLLSPKIPANIKKRLEKGIDIDGPSISADTTKKIWSDTKKKAKDVVELGWVSWGKDTGYTIELQTSEGEAVDHFTIGFHKYRFLQDATGFDEIRADLSDLSALALYRDGKMVGIVMPLSLGGENKFTPDPTETTTEEHDAEGGFTVIPQRAPKRPTIERERKWLTPERAKSEDPDLAKFFHRTDRLESPRRKIMNVGRAIRTGVAERFKYLHHIPRTEETAFARERIRHTHEAAATARRRAIEDVEQYIEGGVKKIRESVDATGYELLRQKVFLEDMKVEAERAEEEADLLRETDPEATAEDLKRVRERRTPKGVTKEKILAELSRVDALVEQVPSVKDAHRMRTDLWQTVSDDLFERGIISEEAAKNPAYVRHFVLEYVDAERQSRGRGHGGELKAPYRGYARRRKGTSLDWSTDLLEVEIRALTDIYRDNIIQDIGEGVAKHYSVKPDENGNAPIGHVEWHFKRGNIYYMAKTITEAQMGKLVEEIALDPDGAQVLEIPIASLRDAMVVGGKHKAYIIPEWLATQLDDLPVQHKSNVVVSFTTPITQYWKRWILRTNPIRYNMRNALGDGESVGAAGQLPAFKKLGDSFKMLSMSTSPKEHPDAFEKGREYGVFASSLRHEMGEVRKLDEFQRFADVHDLSSWKQALGFLKWGPSKLGQSLQDVTQFREDLLRGAVYLKVLDDIKAGRPLRHWAGRVGGIGDIRELAKIDPYLAAARVSRETLGDYGAFTPWENDTLRQGLAPFYSWLKINTMRWPRIAANAYFEGREQKALPSGSGKAAAAAGVAAAHGAARVAGIAVRVLAPYAALMLWNNRDEEARKRETAVIAANPWLKSRPHITLENGVIYTPSALSDFLEWFDLEMFAADLQRYDKGTITFGELLVSTAKTQAAAPINRISQSLTPFLKAGARFAFGVSTFPRATRPRFYYDAWTQKAFAAAVLDTLGSDTRKFLEVKQGKRTLDEVLAYYFSGSAYRPMNAADLEERLLKTLFYSTLKSASSVTGRSAGQSKKGREEDYERALEGLEALGIDREEALAQVKGMKKGESERSPVTSVPAKGMLVSPTGPYQKDEE